MTLAGKRILLGVSVGISAYKAVELLRLLTKAGAVVDVAMTPNATRFVGVETFRALSGRPVLVDLFDEAVRGDHLAFDGALDLPGSLDSLGTAGEQRAGRPLPPGASGPPDRLPPAGEPDPGGGAP